MTDKILEHGIRDGTRPAVGFDQEHLVRLPSVDIAVRYFGDASIRTKRPNGRTPAPIAVNVLDKEVITRVLVHFSTLS